MSFYQFVEEFVKSVLYKVYGTIEYFNIKVIVEESYPLIESRIERLHGIEWFDLIAGTLVKIGFNRDTQFNDMPPFLQLSTTFRKLVNDLHGLDVADLFPKLLIPNTLATRIDLNFDYNVLILKWAFDPDSFTPVSL